MYNFGQTAYYLLETVHDKDSGVWFFEPYENGLRIHVHLKEDLRRSMGVKSGLVAIQWIWDNTDCDVIYAVFPNTRRNIFMLAYLTGFDLVYSKKGGNRCYKIERSAMDGLRIRQKMVA